MGKPPLKGVNVDEAVAAGAAVYAGLKSKDSLNTAQKKAIGKVQLKDVCNFYMGTLVQRDDRPFGLMFPYKSCKHLLIELCLLLFFGQY